MPELPEVELAARRARDACEGKRIAAVRALHPSQRRALPEAVADTLAGEAVLRVERRGKHQLFRLQSGRTLHVHFRMTGDWHITTVAEELPAAVRVVIDLSDGTRLALEDTRALSSVAIAEAGSDPVADLGPEATANDFSVAWLRERLAGRRAPIKPALLDQRLVAGVGNIYASEALWFARVDPRRPSGRLRQAQLAAVVRGVKRAMRKALQRPERYYGDDDRPSVARFNVYDREGRPCRRCRAAIRRLVQAQRSTYYCPRCQR